MKNARKFYQVYQGRISQTLFTQFEKTPIFELSWSHYLILTRAKSDEERYFYEIEAAKENWSVRTLQRQYGSSLYERLLLSAEKDKVFELSTKGHVVQRPEDENPTIGILLCSDKNDAMVELTLPKDTNIYASKYELYFPDKKILQKKLQQWLDEE